MSLKLIWNGLLSLISGGLCAAVLANTTEVRVPMHLVYNDITIHPEVVTDAQSMGSASLDDGAIPMAVPSPFSEVRPAHELPPLPSVGGPVRIALLLPLRSNALHDTAEAVRAGFYAARKTDNDAGISVTLLQTSDDPRDIVAAYNAALPLHDVIVGPMTRSGVTALAASGSVVKPTIALAQPDDTAPVLPSLMLPMGLSLQEESRQIAKWAADGMTAQPAFIVTTNVSWQRRAARAFAQEWQSRGGRAAVIEINDAGGYLDPNQLLALRERVKQELPGLLFVALDAAQARQVREAIGTETPLYGTSQINPLPYQQPRLQSQQVQSQVLEPQAQQDAQPPQQPGKEIERVPFMEGVRLVDMPWQLQADHTAVMVYPRLPQLPDQARNANIERFYALGIDAYRVAREIGRGRANFDLDGVTGRLRVVFGGNGAYIERVTLPATFREGIVVPVGNR
jgi:outer membrane PBP1 activator LpoA protein